LQDNADVSQQRGKAEFLLGSAGALRRGHVWRRVRLSGVRRPRKHQLHAPAPRRPNVV
jgi:hypothetical protein